MNFKDYRDEIDFVERQDDPPLEEDDFEIKEPGCIFDSYELQGGE
jgi:hypothetical protein